MSDTAFVLSRIGSKGSPERTRADEVFKYVVVPAAVEFELEALRSDHDPTPGPITAQIVRSMIDSRVVIADLTGKNANVHYELGIAHAFALPTVLLVDDAANLAFDTKDERTISLGGKEALGAADADAAAEELRGVLRVVLGGSYKPSNVVTEAATARSLAALAPENPQATELAAIGDRLEVLERLIRRRDQRNPGVGPDVQAMRKFVERQVALGHIRELDLMEDLITGSTSEAFDGWVHLLAGQANELAARNEPPQYDPSEEPF